MHDEQRYRRLPEIPQHFARRIVARRAGHAAARMRARAAHVEARQRPAIVRMAEHRAGREHLPEIERAVKDVAADQAEGALEIERRHDLPAEHRAFEIRRMAVDRRDHQVGDRLAMVVPDDPSGSSGATCWQNRLATCWPGGASVSSSVDEITISTIGSRDQPMRARIEIGPLHVGEARRHDDAGGVMLGEVASRQAGEVRQFRQRHVHAERAGAAAPLFDPLGE